MSDQLHFHSYRRSQAAAGASGGSPRLTGKLSLTLAETNGPQADTVPVDFLLMGPPDVSGLKPGAVRRTYPANGAFDVEVDKCPYVEFAAEDLPWRYSPEPNHDTLRPWLLLVVGTGDELFLLGGSRVILSQALVNKYHDDAHLETKAFQWAHVQEHDQKRVSRLLSPLPLESSRSYTAVVVPAYDPGTNKLRLIPDRPIPAYYAWHFTTSNSESSFKEMARRLRPLKPVPKNLGLAPAAYQTSSQQSELQPQLLVGGALVGLDVDPTSSLPLEIKSHFTPLRPLVDATYDYDEAGRPLIHLPLYGAPWLAAQEDEPAWMSELNDDPRLRGIAGLGMWAGIEWQERIVDAAAQQLGTFYSAARRIRQLTTGLAAARFLWQHRLPKEETHRLQVLGPVLSRVALPGGGSALNQVTNAGRPLPPALFSSAARRLLRPGTARARLVQEGALAPAPLFARMNTCPAEDRDHPQRLLHAGHFSTGLEEKIAAADAQAGDFDLSGIAFEEVWPFQEEERQEWVEAGLTFDDSFQAVYHYLAETSDSRRDLLRAAHNPFPVRPCEQPRQQVGLERLSSQLHDALSPMGDDAFIIRRVLAAISGLDDQPLTPPELCLDFHIPAWKFLNEFNQDWFLPGLEEMHHWMADVDGQKIIDPAKDPVLAAKTNGRFTDAFLIGFNQQALAELRWRNVPLAAGCTPLRRFWEPLRPELPGQESEPGEDIVGIHKWLDNSPLGDPQHEAEEAKGDNLVLIFKSLLWQRYPETLIYLLPDDEGTKPKWDADPLTPNVHVEIGRNVVAFGFPQKVDVLDTHWVIIEQVPQDYTFYNASGWPGLPQQPDQQATSAQFAQTAFAQAVRVLIFGTELKPPN